jgi:HEAT repeat protein
MLRFTLLACLVMFLFCFGAAFGVKINRVKATQKQSGGRLNELVNRVASDRADHLALQEMIDRLQSGDRFERRTAATYLGWSGASATPAVPALMSALNSEDPFLQLDAAIALGSIGPAASEATPALLRVMDGNRHRDLGWLAAAALGKIAHPNDKRAQSALAAAAGKAKATATAKPGDANLQFHAQRALIEIERRRRREPVDDLH